MRVPYRRVPAAPDADLCLLNRLELVSLCVRVPLHAEDYFPEAVMVACSPASR
jgi:hypothetical protein